MKISIIIAAIIIALASLFGFQQKEKIKTLTTEREELKIIASEKNISADPKAPFSSQRARNESARATREKVIADFASELATFAQKMEIAQKSGDVDETEMEKEVMGFLDKLTSLSPTDLKSLVKALSADTSIKDETKEELIMMSITIMSSENPEAALALINEAGENLSLRENEQDTLHVVLTQYAAKDPAGAAAWMVENGEKFGDNAHEINRELISISARKSFSSAIAIAKTLDFDNTNQLFLTIGNELKAGDEDDLLKFLDENIVSEQDRKAAFTNLINSPFIRKDFKAATAWLESPNILTTDRESFIQNLQFHNVQENPQQWLSWIAKEKNKSEASTQTTKKILSDWTKENFVAAGKWLQNQEAGPAKNTAVETYAKTLAPHEPAAAADWAETLPEGTERITLLKTIYNYLKAEDLDAAAALAEKHQLKID